MCVTRLRANARQTLCDHCIRGLKMTCRIANAMMAIIAHCLAGVRAWPQRTIQKQFTHNYRILRGLKTTCLIAHAMRCQSRRMYISFHLVEFYQKTCTFYQIIWSTQWKEMYILPKEMYILPNHLVECTSLFRRSNNSIARAHARCQSRRPRMCDKRCHVREMSFWGHEMSFWGHVYMYIYVFCRNLVSFIGLFCKREL